MTKSKEEIAREIIHELIVDNNVNSCFIFEQLVAMQYLVVVYTGKVAVQVHTLDWNGRNKRQEHMCRGYVKQFLEYAKPMYDVIESDDETYAHDYDVVHRFKKNLDYLQHFVDTGEYKKREDH